MIKNILGLDLGTTSIGWAFVKESTTAEINSSIDRIGVRIIQYDNFSKVDKSGKVSESKNPESDFASRQKVNFFWGFLVYHSPD